MKKALTISYTICNYEDVSNQAQDLIDKAKTIAEQAYAPYSKFNVGAALVLSNGEIILGNNQENIAYPSGLCAERVAMFYASSKYPEMEVLEMAVYATSKKFEFKDIATPCGACRQVMAEYEGKQNKPIRIYLASDEHVMIVESAADLLPFIFDAQGLKDV